MAVDSDRPEDRSLRLHEVVFLEVILLEIQLDRSERQGPAHKARIRLREVQCTAFYRRDSRVELLGSRARTRCLVLSPENELLGIGPTISTMVSLVRSGENEKETNVRLVVEVPFAVPRDTCKVKLETESLDEIDAKAPSFVNFTCLVWAVKASGNNATAITSSLFIVGLSFELVS